MLSLALYIVTLTAKQTGKVKSKTPPGIIQHLSLNSLCVGILAFASSMECVKFFNLYLYDATTIVLYALIVHLIIKLFQVSVFFVFVGYVRNFWIEAVKRFPNYRKP